MIIAGVMGRIVMMLILAILARWVATFLYRVIPAGAAKRILFYKFDIIKRWPENAK